LAQLEGIGSQGEPELIALDDIVRAVQERGSSADRQHRLNKLLQALPVAIYTTDADGRITFYNEAAANLWGCRPKLDSDRWCGSWRLYRPDGSPLPHDQCPMAIALKECRAINGQEAVAERPDGTRVPFMAYPSPLRDHSGAMVGAVNMLVDITDRKRAERYGLHLASIVESSDDAVVSKDLDGIILSWNRGAARLFGYSSAEVVGKSITILIPSDRRMEEGRILERIRRGERVDHYETVRRRKDGSLVDISLTVSPIKDSAGRIIGASKIARDISERKRKEELLNLLAREVDHRSKNLLALVQATVHLTQAETAAELKAAISGRLQALSNAHSLLAQSRWEGADLYRLVAEELSPYCEHGEARAQITGPSLVLEPMTAQSIAVTLHELTTNAVKYGALSARGGRLQVTWRRPSDGGLALHWTESGGPAVAPPVRHGFGTRVIDRMIRDQLKGTVRFDWRKEGLACEIAIPEPASAAAAPFAFPASIAAK
jgi:two-component system, chemotaxis family, CheB/CheR fusion protein